MPCPSSPIRRRLISAPSILLPFIILAGITSAATIDELKKDHTRFVISSDAGEKLGSFSIEVHVDGDTDPNPGEVKKILGDTIDEVFDRLLLDKHRASPGDADSRLIIRVVSADKDYKFTSLRGINYAYVRMIVNLVHDKTGTSLLTGVSEGFESKTDTMVLDHWLRKRLFRKVCERAVEKLAIKLKGITQGYAETINFDKPAFIEKRLAVLPFGESGEETKKEDLGELVSNLMVTAMGETRNFIVLERLQVERAIEELNFGKSGYVADETAKQIGRMLGTDYLLIGNVSSQSHATEIDARVINAVTGEVIASAGESVAKRSTLRSSVKRLASTLSKQCLIQLKGRE